jgi:hypothetical protein
LPKALAEFINQVLVLSSFSVTLLRLNVYLTNHTWYQTFSNQPLLPIHHISTFYSMQYNGSAVSLAARSRRFESSFYPCKVNLNTRRGEALRPHTHQPSLSISWQQIRVHHLGVQCLTDPDCCRAVTALVPTITGMGDHVSGRVRGKVCGQVHLGIGLPIYHISRHVLSTFKRLTQVSAC